MELNPIELANNQNPIENLTQQIRQSIKPDPNNKLDQIINSGYTGNNNLIGGVGIQPQNRKFSMEDRIPITETHKLVGDEWLAKYPTYKLGVDNAEIAAQNQSSLEQAYNGTLKALNNVGTTVLGNTAGFVYGLADWASTGNFNATFDNSFSKTLDDWNTKLNYQLPNYYTKDAQNSGFFEQLVKNPTNTVFNDILNGVAFTVGTIASEAMWGYATGGASLLARAGQKGASIANIGKWGKIALGAETTAKGLASYKGFVNQAIVNAVRTGKIEMNTARVLATGAEALNTARFIATSSGNEAGIEAFHFKKEAEENFYNNFQQMYGRQPSTEEVTEFKKNVEDASTNVFLGNMAILGVSNMAMLGNMFGIKAPLKDFRKSFNRSLFGTGVEKVGETWSKINPTKFQKLNRALYIPTSSFVREGLFEEAGQGTVNKIANIWVERKYDPKYINKALDIWEVAQEAAYQQYGTKQGQKDIWIGGLVGMLGATFTGEFSEFKRQDEQAEKGEAKYLNTMDRLSTTLVEDITAGRITAVAQQLEAQDRAEKNLLKGDVIQSKLAHYDGLLTGIMMADKYDSSDNLINTLSTAIDASTEIEQEEKELFKDSLKDLHTTYKQAESFASSIIGGQGRVKGTLEGNTQDLKESLTYLLVQGNNANKLMQSTFDELKSYVKDDLLKAMELDTQFTNDKKEARKNLTKLTRSYKKTNDNLELVKKQALELNARPNEVEGDKQSQIYQNQQKLIELENEKQNIKNEVEKIKSQLEQNGKFQSVLASATSTELNALGEFISVDDMLTLDDRLQELNTAYKTIKEINPVNAEVLSDLINQYNTAKTSLINYNSAANLIAKGDFKLRIANDIPFSKMLGLQKEDERTKSFYNELINIRNKEFLKLAEKNQLSDVEKIQEELDTLNEKTELTEDEILRQIELERELKSLTTYEEINNDTPKPKVEERKEPPKTVVERLEERVKNILKDFDVEFVGQENIEEKLKNKPDKKDIDRYRELQNNNKTDTDEFKELQSKLSLWKVLDSLSDDNQESVADLLNKIQSLKQEVEEDKTDTEPIPVFDNESDLETNKSGKIDNFQLTQNTNFPPTLKVKNDGVIVLTHLKPKQLLNKFVNVELLKGDVDNFKYGDKFVFKDNGITRNFTISTGMSLEISKEDFLATPNIISSNSQTDKVTNWSYSVLYEVNTNGEVVPMTSGFYDSNITGTTNNLKEGDIIELEVDINNPYNLELKNNKDSKFVEEQLVIYVKKGGEVIQTLKGITGREIPQGQEAIISIRKQAYKQFITGKSSVIGTTTVERVEMGVPVLTLSENGIITTKPITEQGINNIVTTGYIQNGELLLSDEKISKEKIRKSYVSKNSRQNKDKKTPIVVIKQSKQLVAFPIKVVKSPNPQGDKVLEIFNSNQEDSKKIILINNLLAENKISPETFELTSLEQTDVLSSIEDALNKVENFITADDLANKYDKNNLVNDAEISLDLENLNTYLPSQKLLISFDNLELKEEALEKVAEKTKNKVLKNIKQDKQVAKIIVEDKERLEELNKTRKLKDLNLQVGENTTVIDKKYPKNKEGEVKTEDILKTNLSIPNPNIYIDYSELEKGALTNLYRKQDGKWYFLDSNKREQKEMQKNQEFLNWLLNNVGNNYTITSEKLKEKKEEYKTIQELNSTEKNIQCE